MSDSIIIQAVYIAIGPFFVADSNGEQDGKNRKDNVISGTLGRSSMRGLRLDALSLIRSVSGQYHRVKTPRQLSSDICYQRRPKVVDH